MAGCIEDLFTQYLWDFDRLKSFNGSPMEERFQDFAHGLPPMLPLQHRRVADATYKRNYWQWAGMDRISRRGLRRRPTA
jgi:hypothetical protein